MNGFVDIGLAAAIRPQHDIERAQLQFDIPDRPEILYADMVNHGAPDEKLRATAVANKGMITRSGRAKINRPARTHSAERLFHAPGQGHAFELVSIVMAFAKHAEKIALIIDRL